jgi:hypothetical protein
MYAGKERVEREGRRQGKKRERERKRGKEDREGKTRKERQRRELLQYMHTALNSFLTITQCIKIQEKFSTAFNDSLTAIQYKKI